MNPGNKRQMRRSVFSRFIRSLLPLTLVLLSWSDGGPTVPQNQTAPANKPERLSSGRKDFCHIVYGCKLEMPAGYCPEVKELGKPPYKFDSTRCAEARLLSGRGVGPGHPEVGYRLYRFLGLEYRVIYEVKDTIPISKERLNYLLSDLPLAARLISHYQKAPYTAKYMDAAHNQFEGTKGKKLRGEARLISGSTQEMRLFYFGVGTAEVAFWTLKGPALLDFTYGPLPTGGKVGYKMKILVFPGNGFINSIMNLGMFRKLVVGKIREVLLDITQTAGKLAATGGKDLLQNAAWTAEEKQKIEALLKLP